MQSILWLSSAHLQIASHSMHLKRLWIVWFLLSSMVPSFRFHFRPCLHETRTVCRHCISAQFSFSWLHLLSSFFTWFLRKHCPPLRWIFQYIASSSYCGHKNGQEISRFLYSPKEGILFCFGQICPSSSDCLTVSPFFYPPIQLPAF